MVRYTVKPEHAAENEALVRAVYEELAATQPDHLRYATFRLGDGVSFLHLAEVEGDALRGIGAFVRFREGLEERCAEQPVLTELDEIGSFGL
jgi:hypothetical protein